jgi:predicted SAM-dependent methyltransferase
LILNLGCGRRPIDGAINHDLHKHADFVDVIYDLNEYPWPWGDETADIIYAKDILEHLNNFIKSLEECWRILIPSGMLYLSAPHWQSEQGHDDPTHKWFLTLKSMDYFIRGTLYERDFGFYSRIRWKLHKKEVVRGDIRWTLEKDEPSM